MVFLILPKGVDAVTQSQLDKFRIKIGQSTSSVVLNIDSNYRVIIDGKVLGYSSSSKGEDITFAKSGNNIVVKNASGAEIGKGSEIKLEKKSDGKIFSVKSSGNYLKYPDNAVVRLDSAKKNILIINETDIETYLKGVVPHEMGASAPIEALKSQAVTARSLAVKRIGKFESDGYDVTDTTSDQVYKGYNEVYFAPTHNISKAINQTKGKVLAYKGKLIEGIYYSTSGGQTASDGFVWSSGNSTPYYVSKEDKYDTYLHKTGEGWNKIGYTEVMTKEALRSRILKSSKDYPAYFKTPYCTPAFNGLSENFTVEVLNKVNGYVTSIRVSDDKGKKYVFKNYSNRWLFGLRSQQYNLSVLGGLFVIGDDSTMELDDIYVVGADNKPVLKAKESVHIDNGKTVFNSVATRYEFSGKGYGHGIGMSQNGAMNRAEDGLKYEDILSFYYDGTSIMANYGM